MFFLFPLLALPGILGGAAVSAGAVAATAATVATAAGAICVGASVSGSRQTRLRERALEVEGMRISAAADHAARVVEAEMRRRAAEAEEEARRRERIFQAGMRCAEGAMAHSRLLLDMANRAAGRVIADDGSLSEAAASRLMDMANDCISRADEAMATAYGFGAGAGGRKP